MKRKREKAIVLTGKESLQELAELGVPYFVAPDDLRELGEDPDKYFRFSRNGRTHFAGWMLDRKKDATLIGRLLSRHEPHQSVQ